VTRSSLVSPLFATVAYMLVVVALLVVPTSAPHEPRGYLTEYQLTLGRRVVADVAVNIAIFVPIGWGLHRGGRRLRVRPGARLLGVAVAAALFSAVMETLQFWLPGRYSSVVDVAANTLGAALGAWAEARHRSRRTA
jgi:glycopeptide antibiotics resistance protein